MVECLPLDPAAQVRFPPQAVGIFLHPVTNGHSDPEQSSVVQWNSLPVSIATLTAFDSVLHTAILIKLVRMDINGLFYIIIKNMYSQSLLCVKANSKITNTFQSLVGVRQGDVLSPNLFKFFINDLPKYLLSSQDPVYLNNKRIDCLNVCR